MRKKHIQEFVKTYLNDNLNKDDIVVDATIGNGYDTVFLAKTSKFVYGFDIQEKAYNNTLKSLESNNLKNYKLILDSHENIFNYVTSFKGVVFNLGYLPNSDKTVTTTEKTTIKTLKNLTSNMQQGQFIIMTCYPSHKEGQVESLAVVNFAKNLNETFTVLHYHIINSKGNPPFVIVIEKNILKKG